MTTHDQESSDYQRALSHHKILHEMGLEALLDSRAKTTCYGRAESTML